MDEGYNIPPRRSEDIYHPPEVVQLRLLGEETPAPNASTHMLLFANEAALFHELSDRGGIFEDVGRAIEGMGKEHMLHGYDASQEVVDGTRRYVAATGLEDTEDGREILAKAEKIGEIAELVSLAAMGVEKYADRDLHGVITLVERSERLNEEEKQILLRQLHELQERLSD